MKRELSLSVVQLTWDRSVYKNQTAIERRFVNITAAIARSAVIRSIPDSERVGIGRGNREPLSI